MHNLWHHPGIHPIHVRNIRYVIHTLLRDIFHCESSIIPRIPPTRCPHRFIFLPCVRKGQKNKVQDFLFIYFLFFIFSIFDFRNFFRENFKTFYANEMSPSDLPRAHKSLKIFLPNAYTYFCGDLWPKQTPDTRRSILRSPLPPLTHPREPNDPSAVAR